MNTNAERRQELFSCFEKCVKRHFDFLGNVFCSVNKNTMGWCITYTSDKVELSVYYERISFEIYLVISLNGGLSCLADEIAPHDFRRKYLYATDESMVENAVIELKELIARYGRPFLDGDTDAFEKTFNSREVNARKYELELVEKKALKAWDNGQYDEVVGLYQSIKEHLTPTQEKRLHLSLKRIG